MRRIPSPVSGHVLISMSYMFQTVSQVECGWAITRLTAGRRIRVFKARIACGLRTSWWLTTNWLRFVSSDHTIFRF